MTSTTTRWSSETGTPDPVSRPADPFATIPGACPVTVQPPPVAAPTRTVRDNAAYAWRNSSQECLHALPADFVHDYRDALDAAAVAAMAGPDGLLVEAWREMGYAQLDCTEAAMGVLDRGVPDEVYHQAWDAAAARLDALALVEAAGLADELSAWDER